MVEVMSSEKELFMGLIEHYVALQRIKTADNPMKEVEYQLKIARAKLDGFGIVTENLDIN